LYQPARAFLDIAVLSMASGDPKTLYGFADSDHASKCPVKRGCFGNQLHDSCHRLTAIEQIESISWLLQ
jgi:hypothetical protein